MQANINKLKNEKELEYYKYLQDLQYPESRSEVRVPSMVPLPTCTYRIERQFVLPTNMIGAIWVRYNPFFLVDDMKGMIAHNNYSVYENVEFDTISSFLYINDDSLTGIDPMSRDGTNDCIGAAKGFDIGQAIKRGIYSKYRLVSASLEVGYLGSLIEAKGIFGGGVSYAPDNSLTGMCYYDDQLPVTDRELHCLVAKAQEMTVFNNMRNLDGYQEVSCLDKLRFVYAPVDNSYEEFIPTKIDPDQLINSKEEAWGYEHSPHYLIPPGDSRSKFFWYFFGQRLEPRTNVVFKVVSNFECLPTPEIAPFMCLKRNFSPLTDMQKGLVYRELKKQLLQCIMHNQSNILPVVNPKAKALNTNIDYLTSLLYPEKTKGCRIPGMISPPTCTLQMTTSFIFTPRIDSIIVINPWFLYSLDRLENEGAVGVKGLTSGLYSYIVNGDDTVRFRSFGEAATYVAFLKQNIPDMFNSYRLVSASLEVKFADAIERAQGMICGGIVNKPIDICGYYPEHQSFMSGHMKLEEFKRSNLRYVPSFKETYCLDGGLRLVYYPVDNSYMEFTRIVTVDDIKVKDVDTDDEEFKYIDVNKQCYRSKFGWFVFFDGIPDRELWFKLDMCCNFELIPKADYIPYMDVQAGDKKKLNDDERKKLLEKVMSQSTQCINITK